MKIYDITLPVEPSLACWPGDTAYQFQRLSRIEAGDTINLGSVRMSVHTGTHADAPFHFDDKGVDIASLSLEAFVGAAVVVDVVGKPFITIADVENLNLQATPRVLFRTLAWQDYSRFPEKFPIMEPNLPDYLGAQGVVLIGLDVPSVDAFDSKTLDNHHALQRNQIHILESLYLAEVPVGVYELIALPLRLIGSDGSPVRAILRSVVI